MGTILSGHQLYLLLILGMWVKRKMFLKSPSCPTFKSSSCPTEVYHHKPEAFVKFILGGSQAKVAEFWRAMKGHPSLASRPELRSRKDLHQCCAYASIHGDGVTYAKTMRASNESMEVLSWTSMLSSHATLLSSYLIMCLVKSVIKTVYFGNTWQAIWKISLCLSSGLWPSQDWQGHQWPAQSRDAQRVGTQLAGGHAATLWNTREDLEFLALHLVSDTTAPINLAHYVRLQGLRSACPLYFGQSKPQGQKDK